MTDDLAWLPETEAPDGEWVFTRRDDECGFNVCKLYVWPDGEREWVERGPGRTTVTHGSFLPPTHFARMPQDHQVVVADQQMTALQARDTQRLASEQGELVIWVVLKDPAGTYLARMLRAGPDRLRSLPGWLGAKTLDALRAQLPPFLTRIPRAPGDEPGVVEVWL